MTADRQVRRLTEMARRVGQHYAISIWNAGEGKRPLLHKGQENCPYCGSGGHVISCDSDWRCLACFRIALGPTAGAQKRSSGSSL
jgi:hypothetical protein